LGLDFKKDSKSWKIINIEYDRFYKTYVIDYEPTKKTRNSKLETQYSQIVEILELIGSKKRTDLGLEETFKYWIEWEELQDMIEN
jgi:predicted Ser/Thr protein kinase